MALKGDLGDHFVLGRRVRPMTLEYATSNVPRIILLLKRRQLQITRRFSPENLPLFYLHRPNFLEDQWLMLESDFLRMKKVASNVSVRLFPSDSESAIIARIRASVQVEWS